MSVSEARSVFNNEVRPVSWAWRNGPHVRPKRQGFATPTSSSENYWRQRAAMYEAMDKAMDLRDTPPLRQDAPGDDD
jgi:hypothetical protein